VAEPSDSQLLNKLGQAFRVRAEMLVHLSPDRREKFRFVAFLRSPHVFQPLGIRLARECLRYPRLPLTVVDVLTPTPRRLNLFGKIIGQVWKQSGERYRTRSRLLQFYVLREGS
jgi:hypothetical protein